MADASQSAKQGGSYFPGCLLLIPCHLARSGVIGPIQYPSGWGRPPRRVQAGVLCFCSPYDWLFGASHVPTFAKVFIFLFLAVSQALPWAGILWLLYIALEPYVRRRWPNTIISWSRVLSGGGLRDPLVGRGVLGGILFRLGFKLLDQLQDLVRLWRCAAPPWGVPLD